MTPVDLTLLGPLNDLLTLTGLPRVGVEHLLGLQIAVLGGERAVAVLPARRRRRRRRRRFGGLGILALLCCLVPIAALALGGYLLWARQKGKDPRSALGDLRSMVEGGAGAPYGQAPPPPGQQAPPTPPGQQAPPPPGDSGPGDGPGTGPRPPSDG